MLGGIKIKRDKMENRGIKRRTEEGGMQQRRRQEKTKEEKAQEAGKRLWWRVHTERKGSSEEGLRSRREEVG